MEEPKKTLITADLMELLANFAACDWSGDACNTPLFDSGILQSIYIYIYIYIYYIYTHTYMHVHTWVCIYI